MNYGYFNREKKEYIIIRPDTPTPWINYLNNGRYCAMISNTAGGYSFHKDPKERRILRYRYNNIPSDRPGRYIYIKDLDNPNQYWSPTWQPVLRNLENYKCSHGLGYTKINSSFSSIEAETTFFVPIEDDLEIWHLRLKNKSDKEKSLRIFSYAEFCLWDAISDQRDLQYVQNVAIAKYKKEYNAIIYHLFDKSSPYAYFYSNYKISSYDCDRESFIGPYLSESNPLRVQEGRCSNSNASGGNPIAATCSEISLKKGQTKNIIFVLGISEKESQISRTVYKYNEEQKIRSAIENLKNKWKNYLNKLKVKTPDSNFDILINMWNQYQCKTTFDWSRYVSFYETGIGRGIGFRDFNQDTLGVCHTMPSQVRRKLIRIVEMQFENGKVYHKYFPLAEKGDYPDYVNPRMKFFGDDHLWMIFAVANYLKETGDLSILREEIKYVEGTKDNLYTHLEKAIRFTEENRGPNGFPLIGTADWNDALQLQGPNMKAESIMVAMQFHKALIEMRDICHEITLDEKANEFKEKAQRVKENINSRAWDGKWYIRAIDDNGNVIGSKNNKEGKIFLNTQSWAVYSGVAPIDKGLKSMDSVKDMLLTKHGIKLLSPPYSRFYPELGGISTFPPGLKENAAIFSHTNPWAEIAECILGRGDRAYEYYKRIAPTTKNEIPELYRTEPYIYSQMITGDDHPQFGRAKNSWLTGTASWTLKAATDWILGIRPEIHGLKIDPCIPREWNSFKVKRVFRNHVYDIEVKNPDNVSKGVEEIIVDNVKISGNVIHVSNSRKKYNVLVIMG